MQHSTSTKQQDHLHHSDLAKASGMSLRLLASRPRTVAEIKEKLSKRFGTETVEQVVDRLQTQGILDDRAYARQWRESRERRKPRSSKTIAKELSQKGISGENIEDALQGFDSQSAAYKAAVKYAFRQSGKDNSAFDRRVAAFLERRGFQPSIIRDTVRRLREELGIGEPNALFPAED